MADTAPSLQREYKPSQTEMKDMDPRVRQFLDMEARVEEDGFSDEEDEAEERDREDAFIDDGITLDGEDSVLPAGFSVHHHSEDALERLISCIEARRDTSFHRGYAADDVLETNLDRGLIHLPREGDYPLWRIECRFGVEDLAVVSLLNSVTEQHQVRSAFTQGSRRGSIYVECKMNELLIKLLLLTPGILRNGWGVKSRVVDPSEYPGLFRTKDGHEIVEIGSWAVVKKGLYKGDVGLVSQKSSLGARILLIPQLETTPQNPLKRKASTVRPTPKLFDPDHFRQLFPSDVVIHEPHSFGQLLFEHGLLAKDFDYHSFTTAVKDMPFDCYTMFRRSEHPSVIHSNMPRPREWSMKQNDRVLICSHGLEATDIYVPAVLRALDTLYAEVERTLEHDGPGGQSQKHSLLLRMPWQDVRKDVNVGDYVCVQGGLHTGKTGWVVQVQNEQVSIASKKIEGDIYEHLKGDDIAMDFFEVLANFLEVTEEPAILHYKLEPESGPLPPSTPRHPWCGIKVKISRKHHPRKGQTGQIIDVIENREEMVVMLNVRLTRYDPNAPFHKIMLDYYDVVEDTTCHELMHFLDPGKNHIRPTPKQKLLDSYDANHRPENPSESEKPSGSCTPLPTPVQSSSSPLSPAWDPSSRTPLDSRMPMPWFSDVWIPPVLRPPSPTHVLLNPQLVGFKINAVVDGAGFANQTIAVSVDLEDGHVVLRHKRYYKWIVLEPGWVTPKHPNPTHDNGLLAVIEGEHCGKYVRRIHHRRGADLAKTTTIILSVVNRTEGLPDSLSGEELELVPESLCTIPETKQEKDLNWNVMKTVRAMYRHRPDQ